MKAWATKIRLTTNWVWTTERIFKSEDLKDLIKRSDSLLTVVLCCVDVVHSHHKRKQSTYFLFVWNPQGAEHTWIVCLKHNNSCVLYITPSCLLCVCVCSGCCSGYGSHTEGLTVYFHSLSHTLLSAQWPDSSLNASHYSVLPAGRLR